MQGEVIFKVRYLTKAQTHNVQTLDYETRDHGLLENHSLMGRKCFNGNIFNKHMGKIDCFHIK